VFKILEKREVAPNTFEIVLDAPHIAKKAHPGQFVILMVDERSERVPYTLTDWDAEKGTITLVVQEVGQSSRKLVVMDAAEEVAHLAGPLGVPLEVEKVGKVALAAGCYGLGAILGIAREMKVAGNEVCAIVEARSHYLHYYNDKLTAATDELIQTTADGSEGIKGHAVDVIQQKLKAGETIDLVIAVGCPFMMMLTANATRPHEVKTLAALNPIMLDGTGMCGACRVSVGDETKFACVDGPFFDAHQVNWDELRDRKAAYSDAEIQSVARSDGLPEHQTGGGGCCH